MPNYVYFKGTIDGTIEVITSFVNNHIIDGDFDFQSLIPMPAELKGTKAPPDEPDPVLIEQYGYDNWYDWKINNWGCKWNAGNTELTVIDNEHYISFETAWSPPMEIFEKISELYPDLSINLTVLEEGGYFSGTLDIHGGTVVDGLSADDKQWKHFAIEHFGYDPDDFDEDDDNA